MKSLLQDGDVCEFKNGTKGKISTEFIIRGFGSATLNLRYYNEDLSRIDRAESTFDIIRVIRNGVTIWENGKSLTTQPINKMMTFELNGETYPVANHENMKILVDQVSELEAKVMELKAKLNEILK